MNEYMDTIKEFRESYNIGEEISDDKILSELKKNNFEFENTFSTLFD